MEKKPNPTQPDAQVRPTSAQIVEHRYKTNQRLRESEVQIGEIRLKDEVLYNAVKTLPRELVRYSRYGLALTRHFHSEASKDREWLEKWLRKRKANVEKNLKRYGKGAHLSELQVLILRALNDNLSFTTYDEIVELIRAKPALEDYGVKNKEGVTIYYISAFVKSSLDVPKEEQMDTEHVILFDGDADDAC